MNIQFTFKQMESSQALMDLATEKLSARVERFTARPLHAHVTFSVDGLHQKIHVSMLTADGHDIEAEHAGSDMYSEIDIVSEKVEAQLRKHKERSTHKKGMSLSEKISLLHNEAPSTDPLEAPIDAQDILKFEATHPRPEVATSLTPSTV